MVLFCLSKPYNLEPIHLPRLILTILFHNSHSLGKDSVIISHYFYHCLSKSTYLSRSLSFKCHLLYKGTFLIRVISSFSLSIFFCSHMSFYLYAIPLMPCHSTNCPGISQIIEKVYKNSNY